MNPCANCGGSLAGQSTFRATLKGRSFCTPCGAYADALGIGCTDSAFLYDDGKGAAVSWGGVILGTIVHRKEPRLRGLGSVRYRVRMLDGSMWHGHGPTANGTYIRLKRMSST